MAVRGRFLWHELLTTDKDGALDFYTRIIGWESQSWPQDASYQMFAAKGVPMAGLMLLPEEAKAMGAPPSWLSYIGTPDVDQTTQRVVQRGGQVLKQPWSIPNVGRIAVVTDPQGAVFAVFKPEQEAPESDGMAIGDYSWHELVTTDGPAAFEFYREIFGWEKTEAMDMGPGMGIYQMFGWNGKSLGGIYNKPANMPMPSHWLAYITVPDATAAAQAVTRASGKVLNGPMQVPGGGWIAQCLDPQGAVFAVHSVPAAAAAPAKSAAKKPASAKRAGKKTASRKAKKVATKKIAAKKKPAPKRKPAAKKKVGKKSAARVKSTPKRARRKPSKASRRRKPAGRTAARETARRRKPAGGKKGRGGHR